MLAMDKRSQLINRVSIDKHPNIIDLKSIIGDWQSPCRDIQMVVNKFKHRPIKIRRYKAPHELFTGQSKRLVAA